MSAGDGQREASVAEPARMDARNLFRRPSAFLPLVLSLAAFALVAGHVAIYGAAREADEGTPAHVWQLLMVVQVPLIMFFAVKWLPRAPTATLTILAWQLAAAVGAAAPVFFLDL